jgi:NADPH2:quinone reductase
MLRVTPSSVNERLLRGPADARAPTRTHARPRPSARRTGLYPAELPNGLGVEGAGVIEEVGENTTHPQVRAHPQDPTPLGTAGSRDAV